MYETLEFTAKAVVNGRVSEVLIHILDEEDLAARGIDSEGEEMNV